MPIRVTVWNEFVHERNNDFVRSIYPQGIHEQIAGYLRRQPGLEVRTATLDQPDHGLTEEVLANTDVLMWWGHAAHAQVRDEIVDRVQLRVLTGMGLVVMHLRALLQDLPPPDGHELRPVLALGGRA